MACVRGSGSKRWRWTPTDEDPDARTYAHANVYAGFQEQIDADNRILEQVGYCDLRSREGRVNLEESEAEILQVMALRETITLEPEPAPPDPSYWAESEQEIAPPNTAIVARASGQVDGFRHSRASRSVRRPSC